MSTSQSIRESAHIHARILTSIDGLSYIPPALQLHMRHFEEVQARYNQSETRLSFLSTTSREKYRKLESIQGATVQKLAYKLVGKKDKFSEKEIRRKSEHKNAIEEELVHAKSHDAVRQELVDASGIKTELEAKARELQSFKDDLGRLYRTIFDGPTPEFPEDDRLEYHLQTSQSLYEKLHNTWSAERQIDDILAGADQKIGQSKAQMEGALNWYRLGFKTSEGSTMGGMHVRTALSEAQSFAAQADILCQQARNMSPLVHPIEELYPAQRELMASVAFIHLPYSGDHDSQPSSVTEYPSMIRNALANANRIHEQLIGQISAARQRTGATYAQLSDVSRILEESRKTLFTFRHTTFQRIISEMNHVSG